MVLLATASRGKPNLMPMSWHTMIDFEPPLVGCVVSDRNHTFRTLKASRECVLAIPTAGLGRAVARYLWRSRVRAEAALVTLPAAAGEPAPAPAGSAESMTVAGLLENTVAAAEQRAG